MKLTHKIYLAILAALVIGSLFFVAKSRTEVLLSAHSRVLHRLGDLERLDQELRQEAWKTAFRLYHDYDVVNDLLGESSGLLGELRGDPALSGSHYLEMRHQLDNYARELSRKREAIQGFATLNSMIKNSTTYIPALNNRYLREFGQQDQAYLHDLSQVTSSVFLASNALDPDLLHGLREHLQRLQGREFEDPERAEFNRVFLAHANVFLTYLPEYLPAFHQVIDSATGDSLHWAEEAFVRASGIEADQVAMLSLVITFAFILSIGVIVYYLVAVERKRRETLRLHDALEQAATTDRLTGLGNRFSFERERERRRVDDEASLFIVNIDGFKHINDFFGHEAGDAVLARMAMVLATAVPGDLWAELYRIGADDFALLVGTRESDRLIQLVKNLVTAVDKGDFQYQGNAISVSVTIGMSRHAPLLETADMALKQIKRSRARFLEYNPDEGIQERVESNLRVLRLLKEAIARDSVVPHYMPLRNLKTGRVERYECLMRIETADGGLLFPNEFLEVAKESRLYGELTRIMIRKALTTFRDTDYGFSINLSIEDIMDDEVTDYLFARLQRQPGIGERVTLEILESEEVGNYEAVQAFVRKACQHGCRIAIDDFGAGYSNLQHLLNLDVDNLKLDASLIRNIDNDANARATVASLVDLARKIGIRSVTAEYVHSAAVYRTVKEIGVDYGQGFYVGKPQPGLVRDDAKVVNIASAVG